MTEIAPMPCTGRIAVETPGYSPCDDCQGLRALCGAEQCPKAPSIAGAPAAPARPPPVASKKRGRGPTLPDDPNDPRPSKKADPAAYQRWLKRQHRKLQAAETASSIPEVDRMPETTTAPQERPQSIVPADDDPCADCPPDYLCDCREHCVTTAATAADEGPDEISNERALLEMMGVLALSMNRLARMLELEHARLDEALLELRRPKVYRLRLGGEALVYEESPCS